MEERLYGPEKCLFSGCGLLKLPKTASMCGVHGLLAAGVLERASHT